uniref:UBC core domain-containing protein n=1 Tax=Monopterus albus TaxID=43700 RepID=A0A3Q3KID9_MONAL|nr:ubiquitin-conjugating enzyme E2 R2-like isoform X1 [Monopterus albus]
MDLTLLLKAVHVLVTVVSVKYPRCSVQCGVWGGTSTGEYKRGNRWVCQGDRSWRGKWNTLRECATAFFYCYFLFPVSTRCQARIKFPVDYPYSPPAFRFLTKMWHPNIYENGDVCISILHPPVDDPQSGELPSERWNPTQNVRTILLSVISLLNEPNTFSPANVDASVMYRKWRDSKGKDREYIEIIRKQVLATKAEAERDGVKVPVTLDEYCVRTQIPPTDDGSNLLYDDYYDDEELEDDDDEDDNEDCCYDEDDSGTEDS